MDTTRFELAEDIWLDCRRAVWFPNFRHLVVADLHLGYAWAARHSGSLFPIAGAEETLSRLVSLQEDYKPEVLTILGDVVQRAVPIPQLFDELSEFLKALADRSEIVLVQGNHDRNLGRLLKEWHLPVQLVPEYRSGEHLFVHGDAALEEASRWASSTTGRIFMGHEHPAACIGDGVASWSKCPCFLVSKKVVVLPAFSSWAAGTIFPRYPFMSPLAQKAGFRQSIAIMGNKLLPLPFGAEAVS
ncbi:MAG TPA: metallophosphoesterase [Candidatus Saccharimonadales bacterium]|nr:metallophosphoesterase [Candidatus Saccharimonadales bacterium]